LSVIPNRPEFKHVTEMPPGHWSAVRLSDGVLMLVDIDQQPRFIINGLLVKLDYDVDTELAWAVAIAERGQEGATRRQPPEADQPIE